MVLGCFFKPEKDPLLTKEDYPGAISILHNVFPVIAYHPFIISSSHPGAKLHTLMHKGSCPLCFMKAQTI